MAETFDPRTGAPGAHFIYHDFDGERIELRADDEGIARPKNAAQVRLADAFGLSVAKTKKDTSEPVPAVEGS